MAEKTRYLVNDLQMRKASTKSSKERKSILSPQPHTTLLSALRGQSGDEPTTRTREAREQRRGMEKKNERKDLNTKTEREGEIKENKSC